MTVGNRLTRGLAGSRSRRERRHREDDERFAERFAQQWAAMRAERRVEEPVSIRAGESNYQVARVPYGMDLAAAWSWRFLVLAAAGYVLVRVIATFSVVVMPLVVALLLAALMVPVVDVLQRARVPRGPAALLVVVGTLAMVVVLLSFAGQQVAQGASNLAAQVVAGLEEIRVWLQEGPLNASESQINDYISRAQEAISASGEEIVVRLTEVGTAIGHLVAGFFIVLFASYFFLADGSRIWAWVVRVFPRASRQRADSSGKVAWASLTSFVRATVLVALADAIGIMVVAAILQVPFVIAIGVLVFLGAFIPMIGATLSGTVAVLVALVDRGPVVALLMFGGVILVQQIEAHVLQPFLLGRLVQVHPLGVIVAIGCGVLVAGIAGALVAVPLVAAGNAVVLHLADSTGAGRRDTETDVERAAEEEPVGDAPG